MDPHTATEASSVQDQVYAWASAIEDHAERARELAESKIASVEVLERMLGPMSVAARGNALGEAGVWEFAVSQLRMIFDDASDDTGRLRENIGPEIWMRAQAIRPPVGGDASATHPQVDGGASSVYASQLELILQQQSKIAQGQVDALTPQRSHRRFISGYRNVTLSTICPKLYRHRLRASTWIASQAS